MFGSKQTYSADGVARFTLPGGWTQSGVDQHGAWSAIHFGKSQTFRFGSGDPLEVGWVILGSARASADDLEKGMGFAVQQVQISTLRFPEFGNRKTDTRTTWMIEGSYESRSGEGHLPAQPGPGETSRAGAARVPAKDQA